MVSETLKQKELQKINTPDKIGTLAQKMTNPVGLTVGFVGIYLVTSYILRLSAGYPVILREEAAIGLPLLQQGGGLALTAFAGLIIGGGLLAALAQNLQTGLPKAKNALLQKFGIGAGITLALSSAIMLFGGIMGGQYEIIRLLTLITGGIAANLLLFFWTFWFAFGNPKFSRWLRLGGLLGAAGFLFGTVQASAWLLGINLTPTEAGQFDFNGLFATLYRVGESVWLVWLLFIVAHRNKSVDGTK